MKKIIFCSTLLLSTQAFANINCNQQYGGEYNCYNYETGQMQTIEINQYPINDVQPVQMPDLSGLPDPTPMMHMDSGQINDMFNVQPIAPMTIQPSPSANMALQNAQQAQMQINAQAAQSYAELERRQAELAQQQILQSQQRAQANYLQAQQLAQQRLAQQQSAQLNTQNTAHNPNTASQNQLSNQDKSNNNDYTKNIIIGLLLLVVVIMLGLFFQKNG